MQPSLPSIISYSGPEYDDEISTLVPISDPLLQPIDWDAIELLDGRATVIEAPWGQYYLLAIQTESEFERSHRISDAVESLKNAGLRARESKQDGGLFGSLANNTGGLYGPRFAAHGAPQSTSTDYRPFGAAPPSSGALFGFGGQATTGSSNQQQAQISSSWPAAASRVTSTFGRSAKDAALLGQPILEKYALLETFYPHTSQLGGFLIQDWFLNSTDTLDNAFISTASKPDMLQILLRNLSEPGFETVLRLKFLTDSKMHMERISCASAYAIKILHSQGPQAFAYVLTWSPPGVLLDIILFSRGILIPEEMSYLVLRAASLILTTPSPKQTKEVLYSRAVASMFSRIIDKFYVLSCSTNNTSEGSRAEQLRQHISQLIKQVFEAPATPNIPLPTTRLQQIAHTATVSALLLASSLTFASNLEARREKNLLRAEMTVNIILSCIGFAVPIPYLAAAGGLASILGTAIVRNIWKAKDPELKGMLVVQTLQAVLWPVVRRRELENVGLVGMSGEEVGEFKLFFELVLQSAWVGYWN